MHFVRHQSLPCYLWICFNLCHVLTQSSGCDLRQLPQGSWSLGPCLTHLRDTRTCLNCSRHRGAAHSPWLCTKNEAVVLLRFMETPFCENLSLIRRMMFHRKPCAIFFPGYFWRLQRLMLGEGVENVLWATKYRISLEIFKAWLQQEMSTQLWRRLHLCLRWLHKSQWTPVWGDCEVWFCPPDKNFFSKTNKRSVLCLTAQLDTCTTSLSGEKADAAKRNKTTDWFPAGAF